MNDDSTSTPDSRARLAYSAFGKAVDFTDNGQPLPRYDQLHPRAQAGWQASARVIWELATTGRAAL